MKVWLYSYNDKTSSEKEMKSQHQKMIEFAGKRRMPILGDTQLDVSSKQQLCDVVYTATRIGAEAILVYDLKDLRYCDRVSLINACHRYKLTIFCCKYAEKEAL